MSEDAATTERLDADGIACTLAEGEVERRRERVTDELFPHLEAVERREDNRGITFSRVRESGVSDDRKGRYFSSSVGRRPFETTCPSKTMRETRSRRSSSS